MSDIKFEIPTPKALMAASSVRYRELTRCGQKPLAGGKIFTYEVNSTTLKPTYRDATGLTPNTNPVVLDAAGEADIYLDGAYRVVVKDKNDVVQKDMDNINGWIAGGVEAQLESLNMTLKTSTETILKPYSEALDAAAAAGAGANGWNSALVSDGNETQYAINNVTVRNFESIADLRTYTPRYDGQTVYVKSFWGGKGVGGDTFIFKRGSTLVEDFGRVIAISTGVWIRLNREIHIEQYGALPDTTFDSSNSIIACLKANSNTEVNLSKGTYKITKSLGVWSGILVGDEVDSIYKINTILQVDNDSESLTIFQKGSQVQYRSMCLSGSTSNANIRHTLTPEFDNYGSRIFDRCRVKRFKLIGNISTTYLSISELFVSECIDCFTISQTKSGLSSTVFKFYDSYFTYSDSAIKFINREDVVNSEMSAQSVYFYGCGFEHLKRGIDASVGVVYECAIINSWFENCTEYGYYFNDQCKAVFINHKEVNVASNKLPSDQSSYSIIGTGLNRSGRNYGIDTKTNTIAANTSTDIQVQSNLGFQQDYIGGNSSSTYKALKMLSQPASCDAGLVNPAIVFNRETSGGNAFGVGCSIEFKTGAVTEYGSGIVSVSQWKIWRNGDFIPQRDNSINLGNASNRLGAVYAGTGSIQTSDERYKTDIQDLSAVEKSIALEIKGLIKRYKFKDAVDQKDKARLHIGVIAQEVQSVFEKHGLNAFDYGLLCFDEWEAQYQYSFKEVAVEKDGETIIKSVIDESVEPILLQEAGNRYSVRYDELAMFLISSI